MKKIILLPILLIATTVMAQDFKSTADSYYLTINKEISMTKEKQEATESERTGGMVLYGQKYITSLPSYYDGEMVQMKFNLIATLYDDFHLIQPWASIEGGIFATYAIVENGTPVAVISVVYVSESNGMSIEILDASGVQV